MLPFTKKATHDACSFLELTEKPLLHRCKSDIEVHQCNSRKVSRCACYGMTWNTPRSHQQMYLLTVLKLPNCITPHCVAEAQKQNKAGYATREGTIRIHLCSRQSLGMHPLNVHTTVGMRPPRPVIATPRPLGENSTAKYRPKPSSHLLTSASSAQLHLLANKGKNRADAPCARLVLSS